MAQRRISLTKEELQAILFGLDTYLSEYTGADSEKNITFSRLLLDRLEQELKEYE